jgi:hypothetical protein
LRRLSKHLFEYHDKMNDHRKQTYADLKNGLI